MRKSKLGFAIAACLLCLLTAFSGCEKGLKFGFRGGGEHSPYVCAVKSKKSIFNVNNVTLDFYFGRINNDDLETWGKVPDNNYELVGFAIYFTNNGDSWFRSGEIFDDYFNINGLFFVKLINEQEFTSGRYNVKLYYFLENKFAHHEPLTVPKEIFESNQSHYFHFLIIEIFYSCEDFGYCVNGIGYLEINYEKIDEQTVRLSNPH